VSKDNGFDFESPQAPLISPGWGDFKTSEKTLVKEN
jgi:hypothetical protein